MDEAHMANLLRIVFVVYTRLRRFADGKL